MLKQSLDGPSNALPKLSRLEALPSELLMHIALMSRNPDLIYSSPALYRRLHNRTFLRDLILIVFGPTWDKYWGQQRPLSLEAFWLQKQTNVVGLSLGTDMAMQQSKVLTFCWCTIDLLLEAQQRWYDTRGWKKTLLPHERPSLFFPYDGKRIDYVLPPCVGILEGFTHDHFKWVQGGQESDRQSVLEGFDVADLVDKDYLTFMYFGIRPGLVYPLKKCQIEVDTGLCIPNRLIHGPWKWRDAALLWWLVRAGATRQVEQTWEITQNGFYNILHKTNDRHLAWLLLRLFMDMFIFEDVSHWPDHVFDRAINSVGDEDEVEGEAKYIRFYARMMLKSSISPRKEFP